jgi:FMN phosphatase YigB (HAD superfamily)
MSVQCGLKTAKPKALIFDLMGTCCDWYSSLLLPLLPSSELSQLALGWRARFFDEIHARFQAGEAAEDIDVTHRRVLDRLLHEKGVNLSMWNDEVRQKLVDQWHKQIGESI